MTNRKKRGLLIVISGPSGAGKGTVIKLLKQNLDNLAYSVSVTTRAPREGEVDGVDYFFRTYEQFKQMVHENAFLETAEVYGNYYGTPKAYVEKLLSEGKDVILEIDTVGAANVKKQFADAVLIFIAPPSASTLRERLEKRGTETDEVKARRLEASELELSRIKNYEFIVVNNDADVAADEIKSIVKAMHCAVKNNKNMINKYVGGKK
jgi:guanylate kinase